MTQHLSDHKAATGAVTGPEFDEGFLAGWEDRENALPTRDQMRDEVVFHQLTSRSGQTVCECGETIGRNDPDGYDWEMHLADAAWYLVRDHTLELHQDDYPAPTLDENTWKIAGVLREHHRRPDPDHLLACVCGWATTTPGTPFEAHLANAIQHEALA